MHSLFPVENMTQSGDVVQRKVGHVLNIDLLYYANQRRRRITLKQEPKHQTLTTERGFNALFGAIGEFPNASCDPMS